MRLECNDLEGSAMSKQKLAKAESSCRLKAGAFSGGCLMVKLVLLGWKETAGLSGILTLCLPLGSGDWPVFAEGSVSPFYN